MRRTAAVVSEDDHAIGGLIEGILMGAGLEVQVSHTGSGGVESVRRNGPDCIVQDFGLPGGRTHQTLAVVSDRLLRSAVADALRH